MRRSLGVPVPSPLYAMRASSTSISERAPAAIASSAAYASVPSPGLAQRRCAHPRIEWLVEGDQGGGRFTDKKALGLALVTLAMACGAARGESRYVA